MARGAAGSSWRRAAVRRVAGVAAIFAAGIVLVVLGDFTVGIVGWFVVGVSFVAGLSVAFLEIGLSEERERARSRR